VEEALIRAATWKKAQTQPFPTTMNTPSASRLPTPSEDDQARGPHPPESVFFSLQGRAALLTWSRLREAPTSGLVARCAVCVVGVGDYPLSAPITFHTPRRFEAFCRSCPNHWQTLAVVDRHDPAKPDYDENFPLHVHALTISSDRRNGWNTQNSRFWDFEGRHPNILPKSLKEGPGGIAAWTSFHYLWKHVGEMGEDIEDLMARELTEESLEGILEKGKTRGGGKGSWAQADLEDSQEIVSAETIEEYYGTYKRLRPLQMTMVWNSVRAYAEHTYRVDAGLQEAIPVELELPEVRPHVERAEVWFRDEVPVSARGMRHKILVIEGATGTGKTAYARSKGTHSRMCNVWNVVSLSEDADIWILDDVVSTSSKYSLKALSQYEADFTGRYQHVKTMRVRPTVILGNSRAAITKCWEDISSPEGEEWVEKNVEWIHSGAAPFYVFP
jgi:hypothetical protein